MTATTNESEVSGVRETVAHRAHVGIVVIGRNEGVRLHHCLVSVVRQGGPMVYVDSGSSDDSVALARSFGLEVVELDSSLPFTAARARNAGLDKLVEVDRELEFVQFIDGDCELVDGWLDDGLGELRTRMDVAVVSGRLRESRPEASIYNRLCDMEWRLPIGEVQGCGGVMLARVEALRSVRGFDATIVAAEDTELCSRLRLQGWMILHVAADMARHDAAILHASQWWKRCVRAGYGFGQFSGYLGREGHSFFRKQARSVWFWGGVLPLVILLLVWPSRGLSLFLLAGYPAHACRVYLRERRRNTTGRDAFLYALHCTLGKCPQIIGMLKYRFDRLRNKQGTIIEHKKPVCQPPQCDS